MAWLPYSGDWQLALIRVFNTFAGAAIAILAMVILSSIYERDRAATFLRASLTADRRYLEHLAEAWKTDSPSARQLAGARRRAGLAHNDTEESLQRMLAESWPRRVPVAQFATAFVTYLRRFAQSITTLATLQGEPEWKKGTAVQGRLDLLQRRLHWLEAQFDTLKPADVSPWPELGQDPLTVHIPADTHPGERQLERMERQTEILRREFRSLRESGWLSG